MRVLLASDRTEDLSLGRRTALGVGLECSSAECVPIQDLCLRLTRNPPVDMVVVFLEREQGGVHREIRTASSLASLPIYAVSAVDPTLAREALMGSGATEVWARAEMKERILEVADSLHHSGKSAARRGHIVGVTSALPGSGTTTIATGLAFALAGQGVPVALAEVSAGVPEIALNLNLEPPHSIADLLLAGERMDARMLRAAAARHEAGLDILAYQSDALVAEAIPLATARNLPILLRSAFEWAVLDCGQPQDGVPNELLRHADTILLVTRLDPPSLQRSRHYATLLLDAGVPRDAIMFVANRYGQPNQVPWKLAQDALKATIQAWLSDDPRSVNRALAEGKPLLQSASGGRLTRELAKLATTLRARRAAPAK